MSGAADIMAPVSRRTRAYFAPVNRVAGTPTLFDASQEGPFVLDSPPTPWVDLGWIEGFTRRSTTKVEALRSGAPATVQTQVRAQIDAEVSFRFQSWGKLQLCLAAGTQQMNLLKSASGSVPQGSGGVALTAIPLQAGASATVLPLGAAASNFAVGELIAVDLDYGGAVGYVGAGVSGAYLRSSLSDVDYVRRVTLNVARVASVSTGTSGSLTLASALPAGIPVPGMKVCGVVGLCDREGSSFFQEWSALFVAEGQQGERVIWHYPRLQALGGIAEAPAAGAGGLQVIELTGDFRALPVVDPVDGETVVCFRSYLTS